MRDSVSTTGACRTTGRISGTLYLSHWQIASLLFVRGTAEVLLPDGRTGILCSVEREDGSGLSFNVRVNVGGEYFVVLARVRA